jgi:hypothetical protein
VAELFRAAAPSGFRKRLLTRLAGHDEALSACSPASSGTHSAMELPGVVRPSPDQLGMPREPGLVELKPRVLEDLSTGRQVIASNLTILPTAAAATDAAFMAATGVNLALGKL